MHRVLHAVCIFTALGLIAGCAADAPTEARSTTGAGVATNRAGYDQPGMHRQYGTPQKVGNGMARTYVVLNAKAGQAPIELGIALDAKALEGLPTTGMEFPFVLPVPQHSPAPYTFAELDWNPMGHPPAGVYTVPHFDFHFYTISLQERNSILPTDPNFAAEARNLPTGDYVPPFYVVPGDPAALAVPMMGVHWFNALAPELQALFGHPDQYQPFTKTFIYGSWNGRFTFFEPMVTRDYLLSHPNFLGNISTPALYPEPGYFPTAYRVTYDSQAKEYRVALTNFVLRK